MSDVAKTAAGWWITQIKNLTSRNDDARTERGHYDYLNNLNSKSSVLTDDLKSFEESLIKEIDNQICPGKSILLGTGIQPYGILLSVAVKSNIALNVFPVYCAMLVYGNGTVEVSSGYAKNFVQLA